MMDQPGGMEQLLGMAATDPAFREALRHDPEALAAASGVSLSATERAMLAGQGADGAALDRLIGVIGGALPDSARRDFMRLAGAALVTLAGGALAGCPDNKASTQPTPGTVTAPEPPKPSDPPKPLEPPKPPPVPAGVRPDRPPPPKSLPVSRGARPDPPRAIGGLSIAKPHERIGGGMAAKPTPGPGSGTAKPKPKPKPDRPRPTRGIRPDRPRRPKGLDD